MCELCYDRADRRGCVFVLVYQMCIRLNINIKLLHSCSGLGQFKPHSEMSHTHPVPTVCIWLWPRVNCFSTLNIIQCHMLSTCPVNVLKFGTLWKHKSPERNHLTFCYNHSLLWRTHTNAQPHARICMQTRKQWYQFQSGNILQNMSGGQKRTWHFQGVCCRMATKPKDH